MELRTDFYPHIDFPGRSVISAANERKQILCVASTSANPVRKSIRASSPPRRSKPDRRQTSVWGPRAECRVLSLLSLIAAVELASHPAKRSGKRVGDQISLRASFMEPPKFQLIPAQTLFKVHCATEKRPIAGSSQTFDLLYLNDNIYCLVGRGSSSPRFENVYCEQRSCLSAWVLIASQRAGTLAPLKTAFCSPIPPKANDQSPR